MEYKKKQNEESSYVSVNTLIGGAKQIPTEFRYVVRQGDSYWTLARHIMKNSGRPYIVQQEQVNNRLVKEIAEAIENDLRKNGKTELHPGDELLLRDVGYYVPRLKLADDARETHRLETLSSAVEPPKPLVNEKFKYFVIHDTGVNGESLRKYESEKKKYRGTVHGFIDTKGTFLQTTPFNEDAYGTKMDAFKNKGVGEMVHIELLLDENGFPTAAQYEKLADIYNQLTGGKASLIIVPHREVDRGVTGYYDKDGKWVASAGHNDPRNFDFNYFYWVLKEKYNITIIPGITGITQERYSYNNQADMIVNWPPVLAGKPKRQSR